MFRLYGIFVLILFQLYRDCIAYTSPLQLPQLHCGKLKKKIYIDNYYILVADHEVFRIAKYVILLK